MNPLIPQGVTRAARALAEGLERRALLAATYYVDASVAAPDADGRSWARAFGNLQAALAVATAGDVVRVADGTYKPTGGSDRNVSFELKHGVTLSGGYAGAGAPDPDARNRRLYPSILSGDIGVAGDSSDNSYHVLSTVGLRAAGVLEGFVVTGGNANTNTVGWASRGGGMLVVEANPLV